MRTFRLFLFLGIIPTSISTSTLLLSSILNSIYKCSFKHALKSDKESIEKAEMLEVIDPLKRSLLNNQSKIAKTNIED